MLVFGCFSLHVAEPGERPAFQPRFHAAEVLMQGRHVAATSRRAVTEWLMCSSLLHCIACRPRVLQGAATDMHFPVVHQKRSLCHCTSHPLPAGPVFYKGRYHMFYQHLPNACEWAFGIVSCAGSLQGRLAWRAWAWLAWRAWASLAWHALSLLAWLPKACGIANEGCHQSDLWQALG